MPGEAILSAAVPDQVSGGNVLSFTIPGRDGRGRIVRIGPALTAILAAHAYPPIFCHLLAEALILTVLIGTTVQKAGGQTTFQIQSSGGVADLLVCDYQDGAIRGYLRFDAEAVANLTDDAQLPEIFGSGYLAITLDRMLGDERYQGIVALEGDTLSHAVERYFTDSEQVPTLVRASAEPTGDGGWWAGGLLVQYLPHGEEGGTRLSERPAASDDWAHLSALAGTVSVHELTDPALPSDALLWRLFHEDEVRVLPATQLTRGCRCTVEHFKNVLSRFSQEDLAGMRDESGMVEVNCEFCSRIFPIEI